MNIPVNMHARIVLIPGKTRFRFSPRNNGDSMKGAEFRRVHEGKEGVVLGVCTTHVGDLDHLGRTPGVYISSLLAHFSLRVRFDGEDEERTLSAYHLDILSGFEAQPHAQGFFEVMRVKMGELPHPPTFMKGDVVIWRGDTTDAEREIVGVSFSDAGMPAYDLGLTAEELRLLRTADEAKRRARQRPTMLSPYAFSAFHPTYASSVPGESLCVVRRGVWHTLTYGNPEDLAFPNLGDEVAFWTSLTIGTVEEHRAQSMRGERRTLASALEKLRAGMCDSIYTLGATVVPISYDAFHLHERYARFRARAREASLAYFETQVDIGLSSPVRSKLHPAGH